MRMPLFINKVAPISKVESLLDYDVTIKVSSEKGVSRYILGVQVPVTSLCPCSKKISEYGAHNQRSHIIISAELTKDLAVEDLIKIAEQAASCELWGLLKRPDEKYVTERAYDNPKFVEDLVRDIAVALHQEKNIIAYEVSSENFESIHNHSAYAWLANDKRLG
jgi:GTP cyclohydrolase I